MTSPEKRRHLCGQFRFNNQRLGVKIVDVVAMCLSDMHLKFFAAVLNPHAATAQFFEDLVMG